ncbi:hypothetical protein BGZ73_001887 [Actinomortierella ambigua]|nr:hypothetical protein BGZ73_001887 [Actinomortierella ambigua]
MATLMKLLYVVDGTTSVFPLEIDSTKTIGDLKQLIKTHQAPQFDDVASDDLTLWHVSIPLKDVDCHHPVNADDVRTKTRLKAAREVSQAVHNPPPKNTINILVRRPRAESNSATKENLTNLYLEPPHRDQRFPDVDTATTYLKTWAVTEGFKLSKRNSEKGRMGRLTLICSRGDKPRLSVRNKAITRNRVSMKTGCLCRIRLTQPKSADGQCLITFLMLDHNHPLERPRALDRPKAKTPRASLPPPPITTAPSQSTFTSTPSPSASKLPSKVTRDIKFAVQELDLDAAQTIKMLRYFHPNETLDPLGVQAEVARIAASSNGI